VTANRGKTLTEEYRSETAARDLVANVYLGIANANLRQFLD
jgi:hypothetical protein